MIKHYVQANGKWNQVHPLKIVRIDGTTTAHDSECTITFWVADLGLPPPHNPAPNALEGFKYVSKLCTISTVDPNYKVEEVKYAAFDRNTHEFLHHMSSPEEPTLPGAYMVEMRKL